MKPEDFDAIDPSDESIKTVTDAFENAGIFGDEFTALCRRNDAAFQAHRHRLEKVDLNEFARAFNNWKVR